MWGKTTEFCYLGDISAHVIVEESIVARIGCGGRNLGNFFCTYFQGVVTDVALYSSETWAVKEEDLANLGRNNMVMVLWMCNVT